MTAKKKSKQVIRKARNYSAGSVTRKEKIIPSFDMKTFYWGKW